MQRNFHPIFVIVAYIGKGVGVVNEQEKAVVLRMGTFLEEKGAGLRWNPPFIDRVFTENVTSVRVWTTNEQMNWKSVCYKMYTFHYKQQF
mgnify:CR=1 FL=1